MSHQQTPAKYFAAIRSSIQDLQSNTGLCDIFFRVDGENFDQHRGPLFNLMGRYLSARLCSGSKMMGSGASPDDRIVLQQFPGGKQVFKEVMRFCYLAENFAVDDSNFVGLHYAAGYFNMDGEGNLLQLVESWWDNPATKEKDAAKWFDLCQGALNFEMEHGLPQDISVKCFRTALFSKGSFDPKILAQTLAKKNQSFLDFLFHQQELERLMTESKAGILENKARRAAAADLFANISLQLAADHLTEGGNVQDDMTSMKDSSERTTVPHQTSCQNVLQKGEHDHSAHGSPQKVHFMKFIHLEELDYAWISPNLVYEILKCLKSEQHDQALKTEELKLLNSIFVGLNTNTSMIGQHQAQRAGLHPYAALKMAQQWLQFDKGCHVQVFGGEDSLASLIFNTMESVIKMLMRSLSAVIEEGSNSRPLNLKMDYHCNPLMKVALSLAAEMPDRELSKELLERLDLHLQSGYQPSLVQLDLISYSSFDVKNIQPYLATLLKSSARPISYSNDRGPDSYCSRANLYNLFIRNLEKMILWANQEGGSALSPQAMVQTMVKVGHGIDELLIGAVWNENPRVVELLLREGADPDFRIYKELAETLFQVPQHDELVGVLVGSTALHLLYQMGQNEDMDDIVEEELLLKLTSIMLEAGADVNAVNSRGNTPLQEFDVYLNKHQDGRAVLSPGGIKSITALLCCVPDQKARKRKARI